MQRFWTPGTAYPPRNTAMNDNQQKTPSEMTINPDAVSRIVMLTYGRMQDGKTPFWCYVAVKPSVYEKFMGIVKAGRLNLQTFENDGYGEIVVSGPGLYPPPEITREVARLFNTPIKELFSGENPESVIAKKIEQLKKNQANSGTKEDSGTS